MAGGYYVRSIAEAKAVLCWELGLLMRKPPPQIVDGSIQRTRAWLAARARAVSVARSTRSSRRQLAEQIDAMLQAARP